MAQFARIAAAEIRLPLAATDLRAKIPPAFARWGRVFMARKKPASEPTGFSVRLGVDQAVAVSGSRCASSVQSLTRCAQILGPTMSAEMCDAVDKWAEKQAAAPKPSDRAEGKTMRNGDRCTDRAER